MKVNRARLKIGGNAFARAALMVGAARKLSPAGKKGLIAPYNSWKNRIATLKFVQDIPITHTDKSYKIVEQVDKNLSRLDPDRLMFLWGTRDFVFDIHFLDEFQQRFPDAQAHVFEDAGHYLFEDKPEETLDLIASFL